MSQCHCTSPHRGRGGGCGVSAYMTHTHQGQMLIQERASGTVTAHHWICRRTLHTVCLLFIYLVVCAGVCGVMSCAVVGECCISVIPRHTLQIQIPLVCYSSSQLHDEHRTVKVAIWYSMTLPIWFASLMFFLFLLFFCRWQSNPTLIRTCRMIWGIIHVHTTNGVGQVTYYS